MKDPHAECPKCRHRMDAHAQHCPDFGKSPEQEPVRGDKITIRELIAIGGDDYFAWATWHIICSSKPAEEFLERFNLKEAVRDHDKTVTVEMKVNGVEVSPREVFTELGRQFEALLKRKALELLQERLASSAELLDRIERHIKAEATALLGADWHD